MIEDLELFLMFQPINVFKISFNGRPNPFFELILLMSLMFRSLETLYPSQLIPFPLTY